MKQFKVIRLKFSKHPFLNDVVGEEAIEFVAPHEINNGPYTSVLIGSNGVGKSQILRIVSDIIEDLKKRVGSKSILVGSIKYDYEMVFYSNGKSYIITQKRLLILNKDKKHKTKVQLFVNEFDIENNEPLNNNIITLTDELLPSNIIVLSYLINDKFRFEYRKENSFYTYLGLRDTAGSARTRSFSNRIIQYLIKQLLETKDSAFVKQVINLIDYDENYLEVKYKLRYKEFFFTGELTEDKFKNNFKNWTSFSNRKSEPFSVKYYNNLLKNNPEEIKDIVKLINGIAIDKIYNLSTDDRFSVNILDEKTWDKYIGHLDTILRLDLIEQSSLRFLKKSKNVEQLNVDLANFSSGEFHLFTSYIALKTTVTPGSLILIDEPEISLHPNWQMKYIHFLKEFFKAPQYQGCHFLIATHSHFLISDLKNETSEVIKVNRDSLNNLLTKRIKTETYGMSAEGILYYIFQIRSTRNYYFEMEIREMLSLISGKENNSIDIEKETINKVAEISNNLSKHVFNVNDPLNKIINIANEFIANNSKL